MVAVRIQKTLTLIYGVHRCTEFQDAVKFLLKSHTQRVANRQHIRRVIGGVRITIIVRIEALLRLFLHIAPIAVGRFKGMCKCRHRHIIDFDRIFFHALSVFHHLYCVMVRALHRYAIILIQIPSQIPITRHRIQVHRNILRIEGSAHFRWVCHAPILKVAPVGKCKRRMQRIVIAVVRAEHIAVKHLTCLIAIVSHCVQVVELRTQIETLIEIARKKEVYLVLLSIGRKALVVCNARIGRCGIKVPHILRRVNIRLIRRRKYIIYFLLSAEIDSRLQGRHEAVTVVRR